MKNSDKIILDLCGGTGAWSDPYKKARYDVRNVTLPEYDVLKYEPPAMVYGVLAAPPCTMFSLARTTADTPRDFKGAMAVVSACLNIIWKIRIDQPLSFWALENPTCILRQFLGKPFFSFNPWEFGDPWTKKTDLWGYFNLPAKNPIDVNQIQLKSICELYSSRKVEERSKTPPNFALAFYKANK